VDVIHTNSGMIWEVRFSTIQTITKIKKKIFSKAQISWDLKFSILTSKIK